MKKHFGILTIFVLITGLSVTGYAQESGFPAEEAERNTEQPSYPEEEWNVPEGGMINPEVPPAGIIEKKEDTSIPATSRQIIRPAQPEYKEKIRKNQHAEEATAEDESVLSFNFLYYLIQKFKFDSVD